MRFDLTFKSDDHLNLYLNHLGLSKPCDGQSRPSLSYLDKLIFAHQHSVPFETLTRITDFHSYLDHLMPIPVYIERLQLGCGGVCWTLARGFHWLLKNLGFDCHYFYMDPGHVCVVVKLPEGHFYADVGYAAPFFKAKPLKQSFTTSSALEIFKYDVKDDHVVVTRIPGPTKTLVLKPKTPAEINAYFEEMNVTNSKFLRTITIQKFFGERLLRLSGDKLIGDGTEKTLTEEEILDTLVERFGIYPSFYKEAKARLGS